MARGFSKKHRQLTITGVGSMTKQELINLSLNTGVCVSDLVKPQLIKLIESYPERYRSAPISPSSEPTSSE